MNKIERHKEICEELNALYARKNHDYGDAFHMSYLEEGMVMPRIRLGDKLNRFKMLSKNERALVGESLRDTLIDLANYAIMTVLELEQDEVKHLKYRGNDVELHFDGMTKKYSVENPRVVICEICKNYERDEDDPPCCACCHSNGNVEHFALDEDVVEEK